jgi:hypothetical protein
MESVGAGGAVAINGDRTRRATPKRALPSSSRRTGGQPDVDQKKGRRESNRGGPVKKQALA